MTLSASDLDALLVTGNLKDFPRKPFVMSPTEFIDMFDAMAVEMQNAKE